jgi:magnesium-transporting ATPase (P-type)
MVAYAEYEIDNYDASKPETDLIFIGIFGLVDPLRPGIRDAV